MTVRIQSWPAVISSGKVTEQLSQVFPRHLISTVEKLDPSEDIRHRITKSHLNWKKNYSRTSFYNVLLKFLPSLLRSVTGLFSFSFLMLLIGRQEGHPTC